ncbi:TolC family protein [Thermotoga sp. SG1]|uniref:TolC family protein n=1 Tax=Thermotoga sp. SG1 TaxID=126739 RepID=UPI000C768B14|nr:TolC family protein [Thermotoga sp. SG1]PLV55748.1 hypothetical protein AS006_08940 [Thermotoga sp. SG1]
MRLVSFFLLCFTAVLVLAEDVLPFTLDEMIREYENNDYTLAELTSQLKLAQSDFDISLSYNPIKNDFGISFSIGKYITQQISGVSDVDILKKKLEERKKEIEIEAINDYTEWLSLVQAIEQRKQAMDVAEDILSISKAKYEAGLISPESLINAYSSYSTAKINLKAVQLNEIQKRYEILLKMGREAECEKIRKEELLNFSVEESTSQ